MNPSKILRAVSFISGILITIGLLLFIYGLFVNNVSALIGIGIGITMGGVFIFIMGIFLVATEEVVEKHKQKTFL
ncbi:hypothetical protein [Ornithinibacillus bavariensis]|uniref:Uncharacterized protein n=1 Tax=Ornithinibacillus bavariensis TaxID=545502 RepID=A0A919X6H4_9BACI|nr:hypothetical protein [Ornithinibacillus bavariensis]GIO25934.1 hypothetical protein J43TS3_05450 [Ornithinibacillus bavariensis]HAM79666.1 hypothetical protein [Ornithinibacillus sp.]